MSNIPQDCWPDFECVSASDKQCMLEEKSALGPDSNEPSSAKKKG
jgi:hypothetical protein